MIVAAAQPLVIPGDVPENLRRMEPLVAEAAERGARLVLFSECSLTGYDLNDVGIRAALPADAVQLEALARQHDIVIVTGFYERDNDGAIYNTALVTFPDGRRVLQRKHHIVNHELKNTAVKSGPRHREVFTVDGLRFAILICADDGIPDIWDDLTNVDAVLAPTAGLGRAAGWALRQADLANPQSHALFVERQASVCYPAEAIKRALKYRRAYVACNQAGWVEVTGYYQPGHSLIIDRTGELAALVPGCVVVEQLRPRLAIGSIYA